MLLVYSVPSSLLLDWHICDWICPSTTNFRLQKQPIYKQAQTLSASRSAISANIFLNIFNMETINNCDYVKFYCDYNYIIIVTAWPTPLSLSFHPCTFLMQNVMTHLLELQLFLLSLSLSLSNSSLSLSLVFSYLSFSLPLLFVPDWNQWCEV